jgi:glycosyltransferase involved in cell wall biosynthesis
VRPDPAGDLRPRKPRALHLVNSPISRLQDAGPNLTIWKELARAFDEYHVVALDRGLRFGHDVEGNVILHTVPGPRARLLNLYGPYIWWLLRRHGVSVVVCQDPALGGLVGVHAAAACGASSVVEVHTDVYFDSRRKGIAQSLARRAARHALLRADVVRVSTPSLKVPLTSLGVAEARMRLIPYRVDVSFFRPAGEDVSDPATVQITSVGRFVEQKGYLDLIEAFASLRAQVPAARLLLAGGGPLEGAYREAIERHRLGDAVELRRWVSRDEQRRLLLSSDIYVQPSVPGWGEWMPRTILEAMAAGVAVIATRTGGIADVVAHEETGLLVEPGDGAALLEALERLARAPEVRTSMGAAGRRRAEESYDWDTNLALYRGVVANLAR